MKDAGNRCHGLRSIIDGAVRNEEAASVWREGGEIDHGPFSLDEIGDDNGCCWSQEDAVAEVASCNQCLSCSVPLVKSEDRQKVSGRWAQSCPSFYLRSVVF